MRHSLTLLLLLFSSGHVFAWGNLGHQTICQMAMEELTPAARSEVDRLIAIDPRFTTFAESCTFADNPRQRRRGHFLNLPRSAQAVTTDDCPMADDCLFRAFEDDLAVLKDGNSTDTDKLKSLKLLAHWVGDFHQPLHVSFADDRGGNFVLEQGGPCRNNLHSVWDTCIIQQRIGTDYIANAVALRAAISEHDRENWQHESPVDWANESFRIVRTPSVEYCHQQKGACWYAVSNMILQED